MSSVRLEGVVKRFGDVVAVKQMDLTVNDGEFFVLLGPSGCGKTTTLRMVAGLDVPSEGKVFIADRDVTYLHPRERSVAMVFQDYALYPHMTVEDNLSFGLRNLKYSKGDIKERVRQTAELLQIQQLLKRKPRELSGGQRQRVALGRATARRPNVFLFDEPLSNLDAKLRVLMRVELAKLHSQLKTTMIYVTHDQVEAMTLGERIVVMDEGAIQQIGSAIDLYRSPRNTFVAGFIGSPPMNLIQASIRQEDEHLSLVVGTERFPFTMTPLLERFIQAGDGFTLGIRPEDINCKNSEIETPGKVRFTMRPLVVESLGSTDTVYFDLGGNLMKASLNPDTGCQKGEIRDFEFDLTRALFFDSKTGEKLR